MPSKKKKYNARFPAGRIKKIMQSDEEVGKVAQAVPVIISRTLELFVESLLTKTLKITNARNAKTLSPSHMKQCIMAENRFDFLRELVKNIPDISVSEEIGQDGSVGLPGTPIIESPPQQEPYDLSKPSTSCEISFPVTIGNTNANGNSVIRNGNASSGNNNIVIQQHNNTTTATTVNNINIPLPAHAITRNSTTLSGISTTQSITLLPNSREELMRQWDTVSQIRQQMLSTIQSTTTTTATTTAPLQQTTTISFYNNDKKTLNSTLSTDCTPPKLRRMDSLPIITDKPTNITINLDKKNRKLQHQPKSLPSTDLLLQKPDNKIPPVPAPIINIDICNKPIIKIDYSNLNLHDTNDSPISTSSNSNNNNNNKNNTDDFINSNYSNLTTQTSSYSTIDDSTKKKSPVTTFNPIINIDLSKIATQPPTIHFNLGNVSSTSTSSTSNNNSSTTKIDTKINTSTIRSSSLELDEDYDNI